MKTRAIIACGLAATLTAAASADHHRLAFDRYTGFNDARVDAASSFMVDVLANPGQSYVDFTFSMDALAGVGTITSIWFEDVAPGLSNASIVAESAGVDLREGGRGGNTPAASNGILGWEGTAAWFKKHGSAANGIDAGESLTVRFDAASSFFEYGLDAFMSGEARIAFHLQRLGLDSEESAHYASLGDFGNFVVVPVPPAVAMGGLALAGVAGFRRLRKA